MMHDVSSSNRVTLSFQAEQSLCRLIFPLSEVTASSPTRISSHPQGFLLFTLRRRHVVEMVSDAAERRGLMVTPAGAVPIGQLRCPPVIRSSM
jgi:hypothetical protein